MPSEPDDATFQQLVLAQAAARELQEQQIRHLAAAAVVGFSRWYDSDAISEWATKLVRTLAPRFRGLASLTDAYLSRTGTLVVGKRLAPIGAVDVTALRAGVTAAGAYARAADAFRWQQARYDTFGRDLAAGRLTLLEPPTLVEPVAAAQKRVLDVADMDVQLVQRNQSRAFYEAHKSDVTGWRRVIHPERSKGGTCGLCAVISDRLYGPTEPLEVHERCKCTTVAVKEGRDPGSKLNRSDLNALYSDAGSTRREELKRTRYRIDEHGELGRVITFAEDAHRTARQARRDENSLRPALSAAQKRAALERAHDSLAAALPKARELAASDKKWGDYLGKLEARLAGLQSEIAA